MGKTIVINFKSTPHDQAFARRLLGESNEQVDERLSRELVSPLDCFTGRVTLYIPTLGQWDVVEAHKVATKFVEHAQHSNALKLIYFEPRKRKGISVVLEPCAAKLVIVSGWGHPKVPGEFKRVECSGVPCLESRYSLGAPEWEQEAAEVISQIDQSLIIRDYRRLKP